MWENDYGDEFETEDEAREDAVENMTKEDYLEYFENHVNTRELLEWAWRQVTFFEDFENQLMDAEDAYFNDCYHKIDE